MDEYDEIQARIDAVGDWLHAYLPEIVSCSPVFVLFVLGANGAPLWGYGLTLVVLLVLVLACNPFEVLSNFLAPTSRKFLCVGVVITVLSIIFPALSLYGRACLLLLAAGLIALPLWKRKAWLYDWKVQQSAEVDTTLAHLKYGGEWDADKYWTAHGCAETRALLHQALNVECNENEIDRTYKAIYYLAFAHGRKKSKNQIKKLKAKVKTCEATIAKQKQDLYSIENQDVKIWGLQQENGQLEFKVQTLMRENATLKNQNAKLDTHLQAIKPPIEDRDSAILAYVEEGHSYAEAGEKFGLSKSGAIAAAKRAKAIS